MPKPDPWACTHYSNPAHLINRVFFFFFVAPKPASLGPGPKSQTQNHKPQNIYVIFFTIITFSWQFSCHPNGCQDLTNQSVQKIQQITNPRNFANPQIKFSNVKIPPTKHQKNPTNLAHKKKKKPKPKPKFCSQKHEKKKKSKLH